MVSQKDRYALRAVFELAKRHGSGPMKVADIARAQAIPPRFLEVILTQLKQAGFVESRRGKSGGYLLVRDPSDLTVGEVMRFLGGSFEVAHCDPSTPYGCPPGGQCAFQPLWDRAAQAIAEVFDGVTFKDLMEEETKRGRNHVPAYAI